jgi:bidirectional [NiFe] hydrogenase diaphorase subunit
VCLGTACYVKGAATLLAALEKDLAIKAGDTTKDGQVSLLTARCLGACGLAPAVVFDGSVAGDVSEQMALQRVKGWHVDAPG